MLDQTLLCLISDRWVRFNVLVQGTHFVEGGLAEGAGEALGLFLCRSPRVGKLVRNFRGSWVLLLRLQHAKRRICALRALKHYYDLHCSPRSSQRFLFCQLFYTGRLQHLSSVCLSQVHGEDRLGREGCVAMATLEAPVGHLVRGHVTREVAVLEEP